MCAACDAEWSAGENLTMQSVEPKARPRASHKGSVGVPLKARAKSSHNSVPLNMAVRPVVVRRSPDSFLRTVSPPPSSWVTYNGCVRSQQQITTAVDRRKFHCGAESLTSKSNSVGNSRGKLPQPDVMFAGLQQLPPSKVCLRPCSAFEVCDGRSLPCH